MRPGLPAFAGLAVVLAVVVAAQASPAFGGYDTDLWTYLLVAERLAGGADLTQVEPFRLAGPASPHVTPLWHGVARLLRAGVDGVAAMRVLALLTVALVTAAAWRLARLTLEGEGPRVAAVAFFWLAVPVEWSALGLGRTLGMALVLLAAAEAASLSGRLREAAALAAWIAGAFWIHSFMGILAVAAAAMGASLLPPPRARLAPLVLGAIAAGVLVGLPALATPLALAGLAKSSAHTFHPAAREWAGFRVMHPAALLGLWPLPLTVLAAFGLAGTGASPRARRLALLGSAVTALLLFTPLFGKAVDVFGAWMTGRFAHLAFVWLAAARGAALLLASARPWVRAAGATLVAAAAVHAAFLASGDFTDTGRHPPFSGAARAEATGLRSAMAGRGYVSADLVAYALAAPTLGRPLGVPPGHASPYGDFVREHRRVARALGANTRECWASLLSLYPDVELLVTPAPGAAVERDVWAARVGNDPEEVRRLFAEAGALEPLAAGPHFVVDRIRNPDPSRAFTGEMGEGRRCQPAYPESDAAR